MSEPFPIDLSKYEEVAIDPWKEETLPADAQAKIQANIELARDAIVFFTCCGSASGYGGHTGGAYDTVPEVVLLRSFMKARPDKFVPIFFDEAGHRVATQYLLSALDGHISFEHLRNYRVGHAKLPGHPELHCTPGVQFSSGRLGHMWPHVNGVALANKDKVCICLGSDGSQMEGNDAEAARLAVAQDINVKVIVDDNNVTIAGHPDEYLKGYDVQKTLEGHGMECVACEGENLASLYAALRKMVVGDGPKGVIIKRKMCPGIEGVEGECHGHDAIALAKGVAYLTKKGYPKAVEWLNGPAKNVNKKDPQKEYLGTQGAPVGANRGVFGETVVKVLAGMTEADRKAKVLCIDSDLEGSTGLKAIHKANPEIFVSSGIMERGNFAAAAGFGMHEGRQAIFSTFSAFLEMVVSEITMGRLNFCNVLCHFSHSGVDDMADNTCHFGINTFFADNGLDEHQETRLYFPADFHQMQKIVSAVFWDQGIRCVFSTRSKLPAILDEGGKEMFGGDWAFQRDTDDLIRSGSVGYIVSFGDCLYRALDAVERLKQEGIDVGLVNKSTLNVPDEAMMQRLGQSKLVLVVEHLNRRQGLGVRFGTWLMERGYAPKYAYIGATREGCGGLWEHAYHQGYDSGSIQKKVKAMCNEMLLSSLGAVSLK